MSGLTVAELAELVGGELVGDDSRVITGANAIEHAAASDVSFVANEKAALTAAQSQAGCLVVPKNFVLSGEWSVVRVDNPRSAFARVLQKLYPPREISAFRHPTAVISPDATIGSDVYIGAFVSIGEGSVIGNRCYLADHVSVGNHVSVGDNAEIRPHAVLYDRVRIGARVLLHAGCVIGADGFGFAFARDHYEKFPQVGTVEIGDDVEIGANSCIDRAALGATRIGNGTKLDNLVHVAHNCEIGSHVVIAAQTGFSGGVTVGDYAVIGGQVGVGDRAQIAAKAVVGSQCGILPSRRVPAGEPVWGTPARPLRQHLKGLAHVARLPHYQEELEALKNRLKELEAQDKENKPAN